MIRYTSGDILEAGTDALVNTVNTVGVMGKGIALMFKEAFPENYRLYERACRDGEVDIGRMFVTENEGLFGPRWIINFPTKQHWRSKTRPEWIEQGLQDLRRVIDEYDILSVAIPPLGCGQGGLKWKRVRPMIEEALSDLEDVDVVVYEPTQQYQNVPKREGVEQLTPARALIAALVHRYEVLGLGCSILEVQKLAWFLQRSIEQSATDNPLNLQYKVGPYGPYAHELMHLLDSLDGSYLQCDKRLKDATPWDEIQFNPSKLDQVETYIRDTEASQYKTALDRAEALIDGFQSPFGLELLSTVDWLLNEGGCDPEVSSVRRGIEDWPAGQKAAERKQRIFSDDALGVAIEHLKSHRSAATGNGAEANPQHH